MSPVRFAFRRKPNKHKSGYSVSCSRFLHAAVRNQPRRRFFFLSVAPLRFAVSTATTLSIAAFSTKPRRRFFFLSGERKKKSAKKERKPVATANVKRLFTRAAKDSLSSGTAARVGVSICLQRSGSSAHIADGSALPPSSTPRSGVCPVALELTDSSAFTLSFARPCGKNDLHCRPCRCFLAFF